MAIESIAALSLAKEVVGGHGTDKEIAERLANEANENARLAQQLNQLETISQTENFRISDFERNEIVNSAELKNTELASANELANKLEKSLENYTWDDRCVISDAGEKVYTVVSGKDSSLLNGDLPKNATIEVYNPPADNTITIKTDELSRNITTEIDVVTRGEGVRSSQQGKCCLLKDGLSTDNGGHVLAREFNGPPEQFNYLPMDSYTNQCGEWRNMEKSWENTLDSGGKITDVTIKPYYEDNCKRPTGFDVSYRENGEIKQRYIDNSPHPVDLVKNETGKAEYNFLDKNA